MWADGVFLARYVFARRRTLLRRPPRSSRSGSEGGGGGSWGPLREVDSGDSAETLDSPSGSDVEEHWRLQKPWLTRARYDMSRTSAIARQVRDCRFVLPAWWYRLGGL